MEIIRTLLVSTNGWNIETNVIYIERRSNFEAGYFKVT